MTTPTIECDNLGKAYYLGGQDARYRTFREALVSRLRHPLMRVRRGARDQFWALRHLSCSVASGEVVGIIGHNGAGKSTLLKILTKITSPTEGLARLDGRTGSLLEVGTGFHPELTGRENIFLTGAILGMRREEIKHKFEEIVDFAEVSRFLDTPVKHFSSGMYVRLGFAIAAHLEPEILLIDEVLAVGDAAFQKKCLGKMNDVSSQGRTVLFVSHNMQAIGSLCSRCLLIQDGECVADGLPQAVVSRYLQSASENMVSVRETSEIPRPQDVGQDRPLRITRLELDTSSDQAIIPERTDVTLKWECRVDRTVEEVGFGASLHSGNIRIVEVGSTDGGGPVDCLEPGTYRLSCELPTGILQPGLYTIHVGARCARGSLDWLPDVLTLRVEPAESMESIWMERRGGLIRAVTRWSLPRPSTAD